MKKAGTPLENKTGRMRRLAFRVQRLCANVPHVLQVLRHEGWSGLRERLRRGQSYQRWLRKYDRLSESKIEVLRGEIESGGPTISVLMPVYNTSAAWLERAIWSVRRQLYPHWELVIADDASTEPHVKRILEQHAGEDTRIHLVYRDTNGHISANSNSALEIAAGEFIALLDADDELSADALFWVVAELRTHPDTDLVYSDEDKIDETGRRFEPHFKCDWNPALMLSRNIFSHLGVYRRSLVQAVGGFRLGYEGSQDYDLVLRCAEKCGSHRIRHVTRILYHWRATANSVASPQGVSKKPYALDAAVRAVKDHLARSAIHAQVKPATNGQYVRIEYELLDCPMVSVVIASKLRHDFSWTCLQSILRMTTYRNFEVVIAISRQDFAMLHSTSEQYRLFDDQRLKILVYPDQSFNYSRINNWAIEQVSSPFVCLLNDDTEIITVDWLERLVARAQLPNVAAVGAMLYYPDNTIQHAGIILGLGGVAGHSFARCRRGHSGYSGRAKFEQDLSCVTAACMLLRRDVFISIGCFDERLSIAFNDVDLCLRFRAAGWRIIWTPQVELYHYESASIGRHDSTSRRSQFAAEAKLMRTRWGAKLDYDPFYNPNLSLTSHRYALAFPPRLQSPS